MSNTIIDKCLNVVFKSKLELLEENQQLRFAYDRMEKRFHMAYDRLSDFDKNFLAQEIMNMMRDLTTRPPYDY